MLIQIAYCRNKSTADNKLVNFFQRAVLLFPRLVPWLFFTTATTPLKHYIVSILERYSALHNTFDEASETYLLVLYFFLWLSKPEKITLCKIQNFLQLIIFFRSLLQIIFQFIVDRSKISEPRWHDFFDVGD